MKWKSKLSLLCLALVLILTPNVSIASDNFEDIQGHWAEENMVRAVELHWILGEGDGLLRPDGQMSRAQFITMAYRSLGLTKGDPEKEVSYIDLDSPAWAKEFLTSADQAGILSLAFPGDRLHPDAPITREEAVVVLDHINLLRNALNQGRNVEDAADFIGELMMEKAETRQNAKDLSFNDRDDIQPLFVSSVRDLNHAGVVHGYEKNLFAPKKSLTRSQAVSLILRVLGEEPEPLELNAVQAISRDGKFFLVNPQTGEEILRSQIKGGRLKIQQRVYRLNVDGSLKTGFFDENGERYYADGEKGLSRGWKEINGKLYYFSPMDCRMYRDGIFSTGQNVHWFGQDGVVREGTRRGGHSKLPVYWHYPTREELTNKWLEGDDQELRFRGQEIANFAASFEGLPFHWYGTDLRNPAGVYCCGTVYSAYKEFGIRVPGPHDVDMRKHRGYEMVRAQYQDCEQYGGHKVPANFDQIWPGDLVFIYSPGFYLGFNHVGIYMGKNGKTPYYIHSALANGLAVESPYKMTRELHRKFNKNFVRYNTAANPGNGTIPQK